MEGNDLFEGRAPGTRGGVLTEITKKGLFKYMDFEPGVDGSYFQPFMMKGFSTTDVTLSAGNMKLQYINIFWQVDLSQ